VATLGVESAVYDCLVGYCSDLLLSKSDGIEVSYNACGVIANLMSDGAAAWTAASPSRFKVLDRMVLAINSWPVSQKRNINYRSALDSYVLILLTCLLTFNSSLRSQLCTVWVTSENTFIQGLGITVYCNSCLSCTVQVLIYLLT